MAALSAPAEEPATRRTGSPRSMNTAATPASYAPLAPPPESTRAIGASGSTSEDAQLATADVGVIRTASTAGTKIQRQSPRGHLCRMATEYKAAKDIASLRHTRSKRPIRRPPWARLSRLSRRFARRGAWHGRCYPGYACQDRSDRAHSGIGRRARASHRPASAEGAEIGRAHV